MVATINETMDKFILIADTLKDVKKMYRRAIEMDLETQERIILMLISSMASKIEGLNCIVEACNEVTERWKEGMPHDSTLIDEVRKRLKLPYAKVLPQDKFDRDMIVYKVIALEIESQFKPLYELELERVDLHIVKELWRRVNNMLVENPNFKGDSPYYKRHPYDHERSKSLTLELLDKDFTDYIAYFLAE